MVNWRPQLNWKAATLFMATDHEWKRKIFVGGLVLMIPILGWPAILGYRKVVVERLVDGAVPLLPPWRGRFWKYVGEGIKAIFVIFTYFSPVIVWFAIRVSGTPGASELPWAALACFIVTFPIFSPLALPLLVTYFVWFVPAGTISPWEGACMISVYSAITFIIPAGFLRVSRRKRITAAFHLPANLRLVGTSLSRYCEAWVGSGCISLLGHLALPLSPWGVVWCYLGIVYAFNEVPYASDNPDYLANSWIARIDRGFLDQYESSPARFTTAYRNTAEDSSLSARFTALRIPCFEVPIG